MATGPPWRNSGRGERESPDLLRELLVLEVVYRMRSGERPRPDEYLARFPGHESTIEDALAAVKDGKDVSTLLRQGSGVRTRGRCPNAPR